MCWGHGMSDVSTVSEGITLSCLLHRRLAGHRRMLLETPRLTAKNRSPGPPPMRHSPERGLQQKPLLRLQLKRYSDRPNLPQAAEMAGFLPVVFRESLQGSDLPMATYHESVKLACPRKPLGQPGLSSRPSQGLKLR